MRVNILYGVGGKTIDLPNDRTTVIMPVPEHAILKERFAVQSALRAPHGSRPLRELVGRGDSVAVVFSDITRPMPNRRVLPVLLEELDAVPDIRIVLINALGTHRPNTETELTELLGSDIVGRYRIIQHDCRDETNLVSLGTTSRGNKILINRTYLESNVRILTGLIEPHLFAGFSGGPKAILPGIAGFATILANHDPCMIGDPSAHFACTKGNPIWEEMFEVAIRAGPSFLLNVTLREDHMLTGVFAGDLQRAHEAGVDFLKRASMIPVDKPFDIVLTSSGGYPLDISMYQSVKGIAVAANIVKEGGAIILATRCAEGLPNYGEYGTIMHLAETPDILLEMIHQPGFSMQDQWDAQIHAEICRRVQLYVYSDGLSDQEIKQVFGIPCKNLESTVTSLIERYGPGARVAVLPAGPFAVPYVRNEEPSLLRG